MLFRLLLTLAVAAAGLASAQSPTHANVPYGAHGRQVLDFWRAKSDQAKTPLLFFVHGGGWMSGDKANPDFLSQCLTSGISVVSIHYRFIPDAQAAKIDPPVRACLEDAARALQFVRSRADAWGIDKERIGGCGGSAGGFTALWLAFAPDRADPKSADAVARESTRLRCVLAFVPQTTLDPVQMQAWIPNSQYGNHAFSLATFEDFVKQRDTLLPWIERFSPYSLASSDDPPVLLFYDSPPTLGQPARDPTHSGSFGAGLAEKLKALGIEHEINYNHDSARLRWPDLFGFILEKLRQ